MYFKTAKKQAADSPWLSFVMSNCVKLSLSHWYLRSGVVLDCIDSLSLPFS